MRVPCTVSVLAILAAMAGPAAATPATCQKLLASQLLKLTKTALKVQAKCVDSDNIGGNISGPCPDTLAQLKVEKIRDKVVAKIGTLCTADDLAALGIPSNCAYEATLTGVEAQCAALPASTPTDVAACLACWKEAEVAEFVATVYASHAVEVCGGALDETSPRCSELDCTTPLPEQRDLGDSGENDCQKALGKVGIKYLTSVLKILEKCALAGGDESTCSSDLAIQLKLEKAAAKLGLGAEAKCGSRAPVPVQPFCCRTTGNQCVTAATPAECVGLDPDNDVQVGKTCGVGGTCQNVPGNQITWWGTCPISDTCPGTPLLTREDMVECIESTADEITNELLCLQFPTGSWDCPPDASPSGAFVE